MSMTRSIKATDTASGRVFNGSVVVPTSLDETDLIEARYGTVERMLDSAARQWTVDCQNNGLRERVKANRMGECAEFVESYTSGQKQVRVVVQRVSMTAADAEKRGFTEEQREFLESLNVEIK